MEAFSSTISNPAMRTAVTSAAQDLDLQATPGTQSLAELSRALRRAAPPPKYLREPTAASLTSRLSRSLAHKLIP